MIERSKMQRQIIKKMFFVSLLCSLLCWGKVLAVKHAEFGTPLELFQKDTGRTFQVSSHSLNEGDAWPINVGESKVLADIKGPAVIRNIWFTCSGLPDPGQEYLRDLIVKMYWDDEKTPSVEVPFGDFFGCGFSKRTTWESKYLGVTSGGFYCYMPMPFKKNCRIEIENKGTKGYLVFFHFLCQSYDKLPDNTLYFHAQWRRENPTARNKNYTILNAEGDGYFAGVLLYMQPYEKGDKWNFLEGDEFFYIDGENDASIKGTGGEDYFQGGWYFTDDIFDSLYHGLILKDQKEIQVSCYRFHLLDKINFSKSIRAEIEHGNRPKNGAKADFCSTAFWYQIEPHKPFEPLPADRKPIVLKPAFILPGALEWEGTPETGPMYMSTYNKIPWSNNMGASFAGDIGKSSEKDFSVPKDGDYIIGANFIGHANGAIAKISVDGNDVGNELDTYTDDPRDAYLLNCNEAMGHIELGKVTLKEGSHKLKVTIAGKNKKAKASELIIDCVTVNPSSQQK